MDFEFTVKKEEDYANLRVRHLRSADSVPAFVELSTAPTPRKGGSQGGERHRPVTNVMPDSIMPGWWKTTTATANTTRETSTPDGSQRSSITSQENQPKEKLGLNRYGT